MTAFLLILIVAIAIYEPFCVTSDVDKAMEGNKKLVEFKVGDDETLLYGLEGIQYDRWGNPKTWFLTVLPEFEGLTQDANWKTILAKPYLKMQLRKYGEDFRRFMFWEKIKTWQEDVVKIIYVLDFTMVAGEEYQVVIGRIPTEVIANLKGTLSSDTKYVEITMDAYEQSCIKYLYEDYEGYTPLTTCT